MGNEGGTIAKRQDLLLLHLKDSISANQQTELDDKSSTILNTCTISSSPLNDGTNPPDPIVSDYKGKLYLKEKVLGYLLEQKQKPSGISSLAHIKSMSDLIELQISWAKDEIAITCPITHSGGVYAYLRPCGCVMGYKFLQELSKHVKTEEEEQECPICEAKFNLAYDIVILNPNNDGRITEVNESSYKYLRDVLMLHHCKKPIKTKKTDKKRNREAKANSNPKKLQKVSAS